MTVRSITIERLPGARLKGPGTLAVLTFTASVRDRLR
jgi:hypothetical protein